MTRVLTTSFVLLLLAGCGGGGGAAGSSAPPERAQPPAAPSAAEQLADDLAGLDLPAVYDESFEALMYRTPESIVAQALTDIYPLASATLDDVSEAYQRETFAMYRVVLESLHGFDRVSLSPEDQLTYDFYAWFLQDHIDQEAFFYNDFIATYNFFGVQSRTQRFFTDIHPLVTKQDAEDYVARLRDVLRKFRDVANHLNRQNAEGIIEPASTMDAAIFGLNAIADGGADNNPYFTAFTSKLAAVAGLSASEIQELRAAARDAVTSSVIPAYRELRSAMQSLRSAAPAAIGVGQYANGPEYYDYILRHHTTTGLSAADIHRLGLDELQRIHSEMRVVFDQLGYPQDEDLQQLFTRVANDGGIITAADVKATYESIIDAAALEIDRVFDIFPSTDVIVADDRFGGFYIAPSFDGTRPGAFYAGTEFNQPWFQMPSLTYHEAIPGHHTQIAIAMDQEGEDFRRTVRFTAFVEGWALYAERLAHELGWYENDPYGNLGRLQYEALRAARLVIDTGIHSLGWSFEQAVRFNQENLGASRASSEGAVGRYSVVPGQATAYMVGLLQILAARQRAMDALGSHFELREFHRVLLTSGGLPLALMDNVVDQYIEQKQVALQ